VRSPATYAGGVREGVGQMRKTAVPSDAELYRIKAEECERMAAEARDPDISRWFLKAAGEWRRLLANTISN
jgi:ribosomal protein L24E